MNSRTHSQPSSGPLTGSKVYSWLKEKLPDHLFLVGTGIAGFCVLSLSIVIVGILSFGASPTIRALGWRFLTGTIWSPNANIYGVIPFVDGTLLTSGVALFLAVPLALGAAIFLTTHAPGWLRRPVGTAIELLAAVPSIIYGFWGIYVLAPYMRYHVEPYLKLYLGWSGAFGGNSVGTDVLTASVILAVMIVPTIVAVSRDVLLAVPAAQREAALSLGATEWEMTRIAMIPYARSGIIGAIILGLGRAIGETMAVTMTIGNADIIPKSLLSQGQTIASLMANELFNNTGPLQYSAILEAGLVLLGIALIVNIVARLLVWKVLRVGTGAIE
ncbi:MAG: phosphate ABC transporter permease subunit PstC [Thermoplasmata archaeon]